eukprot:8647271-Pyramimonas_sp.AAC.1
MADAAAPGQSAEAGTPAQSPEEEASARGMDIFGEEALDWSSSGLPPNFVCVKCDEECPIKDLSASGARKTATKLPNNPVELICNNTYKGLAKRWKKEKQLKPWYDNLSPDESIEFYRKHKRIAQKAGGSQRGQKRNFQVDVVQQERNVTGTEKRRRVLWRPFS